MLSKKEAEKDKNLCKKCKYKKKVRELELKKQNLIKNIEESIDFLKTGNDLRSKAKQKYLENILKILKGEDNE